MSIILVNHLNVRIGPSFNCQKVAYYNACQTINSGEELVENEGIIWLRFTDKSGNKRYVAVYDKGNTYVDVRPSIPGPRPVACPPPSSTGIPGIPSITKFPDNRIQKWGNCFLCICVKGGLTTLDECMDCLIGVFLLEN